MKIKYASIYVPGTREPEIFSVLSDLGCKEIECDIGTVTVRHHNGKIEFFSGMPYKLTMEKET